MRSPRAFSLAASAAVLVSSLIVPAVGWATPDGPEDILPTRATAPVVLTGAQLPEWSRLAATGTPTPYPSGAVTGVRNAHNGTIVVPPDARTGVDTEDVAAYRWDAGEFVEIPVQVDERFPYFLANPNSDFGIYSGTDTELTYQWDVESWKMTAGLCAKEYAPGDGPTPDPVPTLDDDDEIVVMASDTGAQAPASQLGPIGTLPGKRQEVTVADPLTGGVTYAYLFLRDDGSGFDETTGYVHYDRDDNADQWIDRASFADDDPEKLGSSNTGYGPNLSGTVCDVPEVPRTELSTDRFPRDGVTVSTDAYRWSASGRWMVRGMEVAKPNEPGVYGPDLIDRWKGRAFQSSPDSTISVVGFEDEQVNWEANSSLLGERMGPVRAIREVWGADSGTNVTKTETFYRDAVAYRYRMRVHPIPSDGLYTSWDYNARVATRYFNAIQPEGVAIDGFDDEVYGNIDEIGGQPAFFDAPDATFDVPVALLKWEQVSGVGDSGSLVYVLENKGASTLANPTVVPFYRDDKCFDDGTGDNPVARPWPGEASTDQRVVDAYGDATCDEKQGAWGSHGIHYFATGDTDNAFVGTPVPVNEVDAQQWQFAVPTAEPVAVGEPYAQEVRAPLVTGAVSQESTPDTPHETSLTITGDRVGQATDGAVLAAKLFDLRDGSPVAAQSLSFSFQGQTLTASTDADGVASVAVEALEGPAGLYDLGVDFAGTDELKSSSVTALFEVQREDTTLSVASPGPMVLTSRLTETDPLRGLGGKVVRFLVDGSEVGSATTDGDGWATVVLAKRLKRNAVVEAVFDGDDTYVGSRARL